MYSEYIQNSIYIICSLFDQLTTLNYGGAQPPLIIKWGPPAPRFSVSEQNWSTELFAVQNGTFHMQPLKLDTSLTKPLPSVSGDINTGCYINGKAFYSGLAKQLTTSTPFLNCISSICSLIKLNIHISMEIIEASIMYLLCIFIPAFFLK